MLPYLINNDRLKGVQRIRKEINNILLMDLAARSTNIMGPANVKQYIIDDEIEMKAKFIMGLFQQRNTFKDRLCDKWTPLQFLECSKKMKLVQIKAMNKIYSFGDVANCVYIILRGAVRIFGQQHLELGSKTFRKIYQEDLFPGEIFGETALEGVNTRTTLVQTITDCDIALISCDDYLTVQNASHGSSAIHGIQLSIDAKYTFLSKIHILKNWEQYRLYRLASAMYQIHLAPNKLVLNKGHVNTDICIIMNGSIHVITDYDEYIKSIGISNGNNNVTNIITTLRECDIYGETGALNTLLRLKVPIVECCDAVTATYCDILVLPAVQYYLLDDNQGTIHHLKTGYAYKRQWRLERYEQLLLGKMKQTEKYEKRIKEKSKNEVIGTTNNNMISELSYDDDDDDGGPSITEIYSIGKEIKGNSNFIPINIMFHEREDMKSKSNSKLHEDNTQYSTIHTNSIYSTIEKDQSINNPFHREKILGPTTVRSLALQTKLVDSSKDVRLFHDEKDFVLSLTPNEQRLLRKKISKNISLPPIPINDETNHFSDTNIQLFAPIKAMFATT